MKVSYIKPFKNGHDYKMSLSPSSCDFSEDAIQRYLKITQKIDGSVQPFDFKVTKIGPNQYIVNLILSSDVFQESTFDMELGFLTGSPKIPVTFIPSPFLESIQDNIQAIQTAMSVVLGGSFFGTLALGSTSVLWSRMSFQQFIGYFIYINIGYPFQVELFLRIITFSFWDYLPNPLRFLTKSISVEFLNPLEANDEYDPLRNLLNMNKHHFSLKMEAR